MQDRGGSDAMEARLNHSNPRFKLARWCGIAAVLIYFLRGTVLPRFLHLSEIFLLAITGLILFVTAGLLVANGGRWRWSWPIVLFTFAIGLCQAEQFNLAALHWVGLALLIVVVGPVVLSPTATQVRSSAWRFVVNGLPRLVAIFFVWYVLRLPSFGAGFFTSFMNHCMLLGPIAGLGVVIAMARAIHERSWRWGLLAVAGLFPVLASGSRVATLATLAGVCFLLVRRKPILGIVSLLVCAVVIFGFVSRGRNLDSPADTLTGAMASKGNLNSRTGLWQSRIVEFESSPLFGVGIAMGSGSGADKEESGNIRVEPGSCYLAVLAMTGALGSIAFFSALGVLLFQFGVSRRMQGLDKDILSVVGVFLAVHGVAEGWILGFGSPLCFLFWLWLGNVGDAALKPARAKVKRSLHAVHGRMLPHSLGRGSARGWRASAG